MAFTETTRTSYGKRLGNSLGGVLMGVILFMAGTALILIISTFVKLL